MERYVGLDVSLKPSLPERSGGEIALGFAMIERAERASHIDAHAIMRRA